MVTAVTLTRRRHPFEGRSLRVLGSRRRAGAVELLVVLPDGSKTLIPAEWTDLDPARAAAEPAVGSLADLLAAVALLSALSARIGSGQEQAARQSPCKEDNRAACAAQSAAGPGSGATPAAFGPASRPTGRGGNRHAGQSDRPGRRPNADGGGRG